MTLASVCAREKYGNVGMWEVIERAGVWGAGIPLTQLPGWNRPRLGLTEFFSEIDRGPACGPVSWPGRLRV
jgi:hypothetical protein